jgi:hypothetical protein
MFITKLQHSSAFMLMSAGLRGAVPLTSMSIGCISVSDKVQGLNFIGPHTLNRSLFEYVLLRTCVLSTGMSQVTDSGSIVAVWGKAGKYIY